MVDVNGVVAWHGTTSLWGRAKPSRTSGVSTPLRFPGQYADDETGLHYNVFRYYDPGTGRYLSQDPLGLSPAPNPVAYAPNPLLDSDPLGLGLCQSSMRPDRSESPTPPNRPRPLAGGDAGNVQNSNPTSKLPSNVKPAGDGGPGSSGKPDNTNNNGGEGSSGKPDNTNNNGGEGSSGKPDNTNNNGGEGSSGKPDNTNNNGGEGSSGKPDNTQSDGGEGSSGKQDDPNDGNSDGGEGSSNKQDDPNDGNSDGDGGEGSSGNDDFTSKVDDFKQQLGIDGPIKTLNVPDDPNIKLNTPVSELPPGVANGLTPDDQGKLVGELMGFKKDDILGEPDFGNFKAHEALDMQGGGGYNHQSGVINLQANADDKTLFHEMGHVKQHENGFTQENTNQSILEYHNVLLNENKLEGPLRDNYMHGGVPGGQQGKQSWDEVLNSVNNLPEGDPRKANNQAALNQINDVLSQDPRYQGKADIIKQNLADEYFKK